MAVMNIALRALVVWLMLLTVPFQGFASASMLLCAPLAGDTAPAARARQGGHDHAAMLAAAHGAQQEHDGHHASHEAGPAIDDGADGGDHCGATGACCVGALAPDFPDALPAQAVASQAIPFHAGVPSAVDLAGLERPPRVTLS